MKKIKFLIALAAVAASFASCAVRAQTTTGTGPSSVWGDITDLAGRLGISTDITNYALAPFFGVKEDGNQLAAGALLLMNATNYFAPTLGIDHLWYGGKAGSANIVSGGVTLKVTSHPFQWFGANPNTWLGEIGVTPYGVALAGASWGNTGQPGGGLASILRGGANVDFLTISKYKLGLGGDYGTRAGSGRYDGNWYDVTVNVRFNF